MARFIRRVSALAFAAIVIAAAPAARADWVPDGVSICTAPGGQSRCAVVSDGAGGAIATWNDTRFLNDNIYAQRVYASGEVAWTASGVPVCTDLWIQQNPVIAPDGAGGAIIAWQDDRLGHDDIYAQRINASGEVLWTANGLSVVNASGDQEHPVIVSDGSGGAIVAWRDDRDDDYDIYAQRIDASGSPQWASGGVALCVASGYQGDPQIAGDGSGGAIVAWSDYRPPGYDIYAQRISSSGSVQWTADGVALCTATDLQYFPVIVSDGAGGAIVAWQDNRESNDDIYAQRVSASGAVQWTADGVALCTADNDQYGPAIASDCGGGAIVIWYDLRSSSDSNIYAQRVAASGAVQWTADGVAVCAATGGQEDPVIVSDGAGGAVAAWTDGRSGTSADIYCQRIEASGALRWTEDGIAVCGADGNQQYPVAVEDGIGGAVVAWSDWRAGNPDLYAQRVCYSGIGCSASGVPDREGGAGELAQNVPNPFQVSTAIGFSMTRAGHVRLSVFDARGRLVKVLADDFRGPDSYVEVWDGRNDKDRRAPAGTYFYFLELPDWRSSRKMTLAR